MTAAARDEAPELITLAKAQALLDVGRTKMWELARSELAHAVVRIGRSVKLDRRDVTAWIEARKAACPSPSSSPVPASAEDPAADSMRRVRKGVERLERRERLKAQRVHSTLPPISPPEAPGVYAIEGAPGWVKIGKAASIAARMRALQGAQPAPLRLLAVLSDDPADERATHERWAHLRGRGEWFQLDGQLIAFLRERRAR